MLRTKKDIRDAVADSAYEITGYRYYKRDIEVIVDAIFYAIETALVAGEQVQIRGFGSFNIHQYHDRRVLSPKDGKEIIIPAYRGVKFVPSDNLKQAVASGVSRWEPSSTPK